ncbi:RNA polymerase sigma-70 factor [Neolewinella agarilytica]|uniref:RNA polymerase sigma-70 factor n=1 Tax=Neolewinella agarilytica TaxID=478744 RepID=UPI0023540FC2|nr:RNA polymerase sigma-70 factor [Neolewinella agarilytica]
MQPNSTITDEQLLGRLRAGDASALDVLFRRHYVDLCRLANRYVQNESQAEDLIQELFASVWEKKEKLPDDLSSVGGYLRRAARNRSLNFLRDQNRIPVNDGEVPESISAGSLASDALEQDDLRQRIDGAINRLPERCRLVFTMSKIDDMSNREIAESLEISPKTVENQMTRAYRFLREWLAIGLLICLSASVGQLLDGGRIHSKNTAQVCQTTFAIEKTTFVLGGGPNFGVNALKASLSLNRK